MIKHRISATSATLIATVATVLTATVPASAHETGAIHLASSQVAVGGTIDIRGEKLPKSQTLKLQLRGILDTYQLGEVQTDTGGAFHSPFTVPATVPVAQYTVVVIASDGDVTARADLSVVAATTTASAQPAAGAGSMAGMPGMSGEATAELMHIDRTTTTGQWAIIYTIIALSLIGGLLLLRISAGATDSIPRTD